MKAQICSLARLPPTVLAGLWSLLPCPHQHLVLGAGDAEKAREKLQSPQPPPPNPNRKTQLQARRPEGRGGRKLSGSVSTAHAKLPGVCEEDSRAEMAGNCPPRQQARQLSPRPQRALPHVPKSPLPSAGLSPSGMVGLAGSSRGRNM